MLENGVGHIRALGVIVVLGLLGALVPASPSLAADDIRYDEKPIASWSTNGSVYSVALVGDVVYVGGAFTKAVSADRDVERDRRNLAAFDRITGELLDFRADTNGVVRGIAGDGETVWIGGTFTEVAGQDRMRAAALDAVSGDVRSGFKPDVDGHVWHVEYGNGRVYIGGEFREVDDEEQRRVASLDPVTGSVDQDFRARGSGTVRSLAFSAERDTLYVGGSFTSIGGTSRDHLAGIDPDTGAAKGAAFDPPGAIVMDVDVSDDGSMVFAAIGGKRNRAQAWSTSSGSRRWDQKAMGDVQAISYEDDRVYFGFHEGFGGSTNVRLLAAKASSGSLDGSFRPSVNSFYGIWDIDAAPGALIAGGEFSRVEGVRVKGSAIFPRDGIPDLEPPSRVSGIHAAAASATSIEVAWTPATDDVGINGYVVRRDGVVVATVSSAVFLDEGLAPQTDYEYSVEALDSVNRSGGISSRVVLQTWARVLESDTLWRYHDGGSLGQAWLGQGFDDAPWPVGGAQLGFGDNDETTEIEKGELTYYFRKEFRTPDGREVLDASIRLIRDDGAVVYLNGIEVMRSNMPAGPVTHNIPAASTTGGSDEDRWFTESVDPNLFTPGINVLAVEVHQRTENSSDVSFALGLDAELSDEPFDTSPPSAPKNLTIETGSASSLTLEWRAASDDRGIDGYIVKRNGVRVGYTTALTFVDDNLAPSTTYRYRVIAVDTSLNEGPPTPRRNGTTLADATPPSKPRQLRVVNSTGTSLKIKWSRAADDIGVSRYVIKVDGKRIGTTTGRSFVLRDLDPETEYRLTVRAVDTSGNRGAGRHLRAETEPYLVARTAVAAGSGWRFLDDGSDQGVAWRTRTFDAKHWPRGEAELGFGDGDEVTTISGGPGNDRHITTYFRRKFRIADVDAVEQVRMSIVRDDGAVVYLNGHEILRDNMPSGDIGFDTMAADSVAGNAESEWITVVIPASALRNGFNALAVEIHQSGRRSSDLSFNLELVLNPHLL